MVAAGCNQRERLGGQHDGNNRLCGQSGRTSGNHRNGHRRVRSESVLAGLPAEFEGARTGGCEADHLRLTQRSERGNTAGVIRQLAAMPGPLNA